MSDAKSERKRWLKNYWIVQDKMKQEWINRAYGYADVVVFVVNISGGVHVEVEYYELVLKPN